jgi:hypothetical protein
VIAVPGLVLTTRTLWLDILWKLGLCALFPAALVLTRTLSEEERRGLLRAAATLRARLREGRP